DHILDKFSDGAPASEILSYAELKLMEEGAMNDKGEVASAEIVRRAVARMGYDGIIDRTVNKKFGSERTGGVPMEGVNSGTVHYVAFKPGTIKSATGNRGTFNENNPDIGYMTA